MNKVDYSRQIIGWNKGYLGSQSLNDCTADALNPTLQSNMSGPIDWLMTVMCVFSLS